MIENNQSFCIYTKNIRIFFCLYEIIYGEDLKGKVIFNIWGDAGSITRGITKENYDKMSTIRRYIEKTGLKVKL